MTTLATKLSKYKSAYWRRIARAVEQGHSFRESRKNYKNHIRALHDFRKNIKNAKSEEERNYWISAYNDEVERRRIYEGYIPAPTVDYFSGES